MLAPFEPCTFFGGPNNCDVFKFRLIFKKIINIPGDIIECGVFKGTCHIFWLKLLKIYDPISIRKVVGFDTFNYFPKSHKNYEKKQIKSFIK